MAGRRQRLWALVGRLAKQARASSNCFLLAGHCQARAPSPCDTPTLLLPPAEPRRAEVEAALRGADVFFGSLLFDYDQV